MQNGRFIYGTQYWRPPTPPSGDWEQDLKKIKNFGFNIVKIWLIWRWHERIEGKFEWSDSDKIFALCKKYGLLVNANIIMDYAPEWAFRKYNCYKVGPEGEKLFKGGGGWFPISGCWPCYDNDETRKSGEVFIKEAVRRYKKHPSLHSWDVWNEPKSTYMWDCFCQHSKEKYRQWLKDKYLTIDNYNKNFGKAWGSIDEVEPPGEMKDYTEMLNWKQWTMFKVAGQLQWIRDIVYSLDKKHPILSHAGMCSTISCVLSSTSDDFLNAKSVDFYGSSMACASKEEYAKGRVGLICDWIRSLSPYFWINEIYPRLPNGGRCFGRIEKQITPADLKFIVWESIARGAKGLLYWQYKNERMGCESDGFGLVGIDGEETENLRVASDISGVIAENESLFSSAGRKKSQAVLVYDHRADIVSHIEDFDYFKDNNYCYKKALMGSYAIFWRSNIAVDWLDIRDIKKIFGYKIVYLPLPIIMDCGTAGILKDYISSGGTVISEAFLGSRGTNTWVGPVIPNCGLDKVFGIREKEQKISAEAEKTAFSRITFKARRVFAVLFPTTAEVAGRWDNKKASITVSSYGKGRAILLGTSLGISFLEGNDDNICHALKKLVEANGIKSELQVKGAQGLVKIEQLEKGNDKLLFIFNYESHSQKITLEGIRFSRIRELTNVAEIETSPTLTISIPPDEVVVLKATTYKKSGQNLMHKKREEK